MKLEHGFAAEEEAEGWRTQDRRIEKMICTSWRGYVLASFGTELGGCFKRKLAEV
jgi:hypothetical protein